jgi:hypothetical protein
VVRDCLGDTRIPQETLWSLTAKREKIALVLTKGNVSNVADVFLHKKCRIMLSEYYIVTLILYC